jgi:hypothetical protein
MLHHSRNHSGAYRPFRRDKNTPITLNDTAEFRSQYRRPVENFDFFAPKTRSTTTTSSSRRPANHRDIMKKFSEGKQLAPNDLAKLFKAKANLEIVGHYAEMGKLRDLLREL